MHADYFPAWNVLATSRSRKLIFAGASTQYRKSLDLNPKQEVIARQYALSLSASLDPHQAAALHGVDRVGSGRSCERLDSPWRRLG